MLPGKSEQSRIRKLCNVGTYSAEFTAYFLAENFLVPPPALPTLLDARQKHTDIFPLGCMFSDYPTASRGRYRDGPFNPGVWMPDS